jgi:hypothetical protein
MTQPRERKLAFLLLGLIILAGGGFLVWRVMISPLFERSTRIAALNDEVQSLKNHMDEMKAHQVKLGRWKQQSLPIDADMARREYVNYLYDLFRESDFAAGAVTVAPRPVDTKSGPQLQNKTPVYTKLDFAVQGRGSLENLVKMMEKFYRTGMLQQIKTISITRPLTVSQGQQPRDLDINLTVEALIVNDAENRSTLLPLDRRLLATNLDLLAARYRGIGGLALAVDLASPTGPMGPGNLAWPPRNYLAMGLRNIFVGPVDRGDDIEVTRYVYLTDITQNDRRAEAHLYDRTTNRSTRLRAETAFDSFRIVDSEDKQLVQGKVVKIDIKEREVVVKVDDKYYSIHVGQSLDEALRKALPADKVQELEGGTKESAVAGGGKP